jgi:DNA-binding CsgD family transcriptional regulator
MRMQIPQGELVNDHDLATLLHTHRNLLTDRQRFACQLTANGWSSRRIASQLGISHTTVLADLDRAVSIIRRAEGEAA